MHILHRCTDCTLNILYIYIYVHEYVMFILYDINIYKTAAVGNSRNKIYIVEDVRDFIVQNLNRSAR